jgi:peroxiredoxin Q/BCP
MLAPGALAPDFDIPAHDGSRVRLSDLAGKYVLLWFYPEADTPG